MRAVLAVVCSFCVLLDASLRVVLVRAPRSRHQRYDLLLVESLVGLISQQRTLQHIVNQDGPILTQTNGRPMHHPAATALRQIEPQVTRVLKELGMTPATRARLKLDNRISGAEVDEWANF